jgi:signal transduction histidine kinase
VDAGCGLDRSRATGEGVSLGVGLAGMRVRLAQLAGELDIEAGAWGTRVRATVPRTGALES